MGALTSVSLIDLHFLAGYFTIVTTSVYMKKRNILISLAIVTASLFSGVFVAQTTLAQTCGGADTAIIDCGGETGEKAIFRVIADVIKILTAGIGIVAVAAVIYGAILYTTSGSSPEGLKKAKDIWTNVVIGLIVFAFFVAVTNFIIPGGAF